MTVEVMKNKNNKSKTAGGINKALELHNSLLQIKSNSYFPIGSCC